MTKRADRALSDRLANPDGSDTHELLNRELIPLLRQLRDAHNLSIGPVSPVITADTIIDESYQYWPVDTTAGDVTLYLPPALGWTVPVWVKKLTSANTLYVSADGSDLVEDAASRSWTTQYEARRIVSDGETSWWEW